MSSAEEIRAALLESRKPSLEVTLETMALLTGAKQFSAMAKVCSITVCAYRVPVKGTTVFTSPLMEPFYRLLQAYAVPFRDFTGSCTMNFIFSILREGLFVHGIFLPLSLPAEGLSVLRTADLVGQPTLYCIGLS